MYLREIAMKQKNILLIAFFIPLLRAFAELEEAGQGEVNNALLNSAAHFMGTQASA